MKKYWHLWLGALFLERETYEYARERRDAFAHGLTYIVILGVITAVFGIAGAGLRFAAEPSADAIKNTVLNHLQAMPFYTEFPLEGERQFLSGYNQVWDNFGGMFMGYPTDATGVAMLLAGVVTTPLGWIIAWLLYGALAHLVASRGSANPGLARGLGTLALATSPQLFNAIAVLPNASISGLMVWLWAMICNAFALRAAYRITTRHAVWAALFPILLLLLLLLIVLIVVAFVALGSASRGGGA